jgi:transposase
MPRPHPSEFRSRAVALVSAGCVGSWVRQERIDRPEIAGRSTSESAELRAALKRIRELETELTILRQASKFLVEERPLPKGFTR